MAPINDLQKAFDKYSKFGRTHVQLHDTDELRIGSFNIQKMMKDTGIVDSEYTTQLLDNDIARVLGKLTTHGDEKYPTGIKTFEINGFKDLIDQIAASKNVSHDEILSKVNSTEGPSLTHVTETANKNLTDRMTDTHHYTGIHKERFDEDGQGKGKEGRVDEEDNNGFVQGYKGSGSFEKTHH
ncbi:unnamed protein product [Didymodactylos carnosus]|uniref:Uncharacterized protein n=1 Tax=Didymodactylos carnosus TaxID=1234261 RepID=A0A813R6W6_9BILA|nr:unnamed protein product [Didymodactylos carnosus]CAF1454232.1 unnamed protein product [Didymodactylos carnosus]CAF3559554.1 unnamed protein product [Didymodactylos carnosus]CAF4248612.1 unnamed protein product [Didymodactylos carnosus]